MIIRYVYLKFLYPTTTLYIYEGRFLPDIYRRLYWNFRYLLDGLTTVFESMSVLKNGKLTWNFKTDYKAADKSQTGEPSMNNRVGREKFRISRVPAPSRRPSVREELQNLSCKYLQGVCGKIVHSQVDSSLWSFYSVLAPILATWTCVW